MATSEEPGEKAGVWEEKQGLWESGEPLGILWHLLHDVRELFLAPGP